MGGGFDPAIFLGTAFRAACTAIELLAALHSSFEEVHLALRAIGRGRFAQAEQKRERLSLPLLYPNY